MKNNTVKLQLPPLPAVRSASGDTIFDQASFLKIFNRVIRINSSAKRQWGKMNVVQMMNHLKIATGSAIGFYQLKDESNFLWRTVIKFIVLRVLKRLPKNAKAPEGFKIEMNNKLDFETERDEVLNVLFKAYLSAKKTYLHPSFGEMSPTLWGRLVYRHFDHHLRQFGA